MDVRVKQKILAPRVKDGEEANARAKMFGIGGDCLQSGRAGLKQ